MGAFYLIVALLIACTLLDDFKDQVIVLVLIVMGFNVYMFSGEPTRRMLEETKERWEEFREEMKRRTGI